MDKGQSKPKARRFENASGVGSRFAPGWMDKGQSKPKAYHGRLSDRTHSNQRVERDRKRELSEDFLRYEVHKNPEQLMEVINIIFDKAVEEPAFCALYRCGYKPIVASRLTLDVKVSKEWIQKAGKNEGRRQE
ncbi:unnamed protein product [Gongylonema pulchrum]|uniref:Transposase n=1 Tax=Gongylonema pulchrum TaxID=637853 RepID=A0A183ECH8_9BILA|nr:unnamed protein product [Gongylonema pulchrum]